jgi:hypothetical protein
MQYKLKSIRTFEDEVLIEHRPVWLDDGGQGTLDDGGRVVVVIVMKILGMLHQVLRTKPKRRR